MRPRAAARTQHRPSTTAACRADREARETFDLCAYVASLGPTTPHQRSIVTDALTPLAHQSGVSAAYLRDAALYLTTLVLLGEVVTIDDDTSRLLDLIRLKHEPGP